MGGVFGDKYWVALRERDKGVEISIHESYHNYLTVEQARSLARQFYRAARRVEAKP